MINNSSSTCFVETKAVFMSSKSRALSHQRRVLLCKERRRSSGFALTALVVGTVRSSAVFVQGVGDVCFCFFNRHTHLRPDWKTMFL